MEAHIDLARGRCRQLGAGLHPFGMDMYARILRQKYGVDYQSLGGCTVSNATIDYIDAYDSVSEPAINRKFGHDIFKEVATESFELPKAVPDKDDANQSGK
jgi:hypothetical protein